MNVLLAAAVVFALSPTQTNVTAEQKGLMKKEIAAPITETLKGWTVGDDLAEDAIEAWDKVDAHLRATLLAVKRGKTPLEQADGSSDAIPGADHVGDPLRVSGSWFADVVFFTSLQSRKIFAGFWVRTVDVSAKYPAPQLMASFLSFENEPLDKFQARIVERMEGMKPAFDTYLAIGARSRAKWEGERGFSIALDGVTLSMKGPSGWKRSALPDLVAGWEKKGPAIRVTADVLRAPSFADACAQIRKTIEKNGGKVVEDKPAAAGLYELRYTDTGADGERWNLLQVHQIEKLVFSVRVTSPSPMTMHDIELLEKEVKPSLESWRVISNSTHKPVKPG